MSKPIIKEYNGYQSEKDCELCPMEIEKLVEFIVPFREISRVEIEDRIELSLMAYVRYDSEIIDSFSIVAEIKIDTIQFRSKIHAPWIWDVEHILLVDGFPMLFKKRLEIYFDSDKETEKVQFTEINPENEPTN
jgi:hypothetical protein